MYSIYKRYENPYLSTFLGEIIGLSVLWLFWIVGTAIATVGDSFGWCISEQFLTHIPPDIFSRCGVTWNFVKHSEHVGFSPPYSRFLG